MKELVRVVMEKPSLLSSIDPAQIEDADDFVIISLMAELHKQGIIPTTQAVADELAQMEDGKSLVRHLLARMAVPVERDETYLLSAMREEYNRKLLFSLFNEGLKALRNDPALSVVDLVNKGLSGISMDTPVINNDDAARSAMENLSRIYSGLKEPYWQTNLPKLDRVMGLTQRMLVMIAAQQKTGKCFAPGTLVIMADGSRRPIEQIRSGEQVMGPDGSPKEVTCTGSGTDMMYRVDQSKGISYVVNQPHILSLKYLGKQQYPERNHRGKAKGTPYLLKGRGDIVNMQLQDYMGLPPGKRYRLKGWKGRAEYPARDVSVDPYLMGIWIGDGDRRDPVITTEDAEVSDWLMDNYDIRLLMRGNRYYLRGIRDDFKQYGLLDENEKRIPDDYMYNKRSSRLALLAGILDSDGHLMHSKSNGKQRGYEITQIKDILAEQIQQLACSLGFSCRKVLRPTTVVYKGKLVEGTAWRILIRGAVEEIPCKIKRKKAEANPSSYDSTLSNLTVTPIGEGEYAGITVEGELFMLDDYTVVHNSRAVTHLVMELIKHHPELDVRWWSLEMHSDEMFILIISWLTGIDSRVINGKSRMPTKEEIDVIHKAADMARKFPITWLGRKKPTMDVIKRDTLKHKPKLVVIDNLGGIINEKDLNDIQFENRNAQELVDMRDNSDSCIIALHHLTKESMGHFNKENAFEPQVRHVRGSNKWADSVNLMILLHRPEMYDELKRTMSAESWLACQNKIHVKVPLGRDGPQGEVVLNCDMATSRFWE